MTIKTVLIIAILCVFTSCKKKYNCSCNFDVQSHDTAGANWNTYYYTYASVEPIEKRVTKKQAETICKKTETDLIQTLSVRFYLPRSISGGCIIK